MIIVDDEFISRNGLRQIIDWQSLGFMVKGIFEDGKDVLDYLSSNEVDVILTDIRMSNVSGVELAGYVNKHYPDTEVVFMSAYRDFEYAQSAIKLKVFDYVVKPISVDRITEVFNKLHEKMDSSRQQAEKNEHYMELLKEMKQEIFIGVSVGAISTLEEVSARLKKMEQNIDLDRTPCGLVTMSLDEKTIERFLNEIWLYGVDTMSTALSNFLNFEENVLDYYILNQAKTKTELFAISKEIIPEARFNELICSETRNAAANIKSILGLEVTISEPCCFENLFKYMDSINNEPKKRYSVKAEGVTFDEEQFKQQETMLFSYLMSDERRLCATLYLKMLQKLEHRSIRTVQNYLVTLLTRLNEQKLLPEAYKVTASPPSIDFSQLFGMTELDDFYRWGLDLFNEISGNYAKADEAGVNILHRSTINMAKAYINDHVYGDISLNEVADYVHLSPVYFSKLFKEVEGINYINYIVATRIQKSQELLRNPSLKIYEISEMVGYQNVRYFYKMYKNYTGETPTQFRKKCR